MCDFCPPSRRDDLEDIGVSWITSQIRIADAIESMERAKRELTRLAGKEREIANEAAAKYCRQFPEYTKNAVPASQVV